MLAHGEDFLVVMSGHRKTTALKLKVIVIDVKLSNQAPSMKSRLNGSG